MEIVQEVKQLLRRAICLPSYKTRYVNNVIVNVSTEPHYAKLATMCGEYWENDDRCVRVCDPPLVLET